jgi:uncharacterized protein YndB with AHSA1/START domain
VTRRVRLERVLPAPRECVYALHTEPEELAKWWGPNGFTAPGVELDARVGGRYRIEMQPPDGPSFFLAGEFREVDPPGRLVYTFRYEAPDPDDVETVVAFTLEEVGNGTRVTVEQGDFATEPRRELHEQGWTETLDRLGDVASQLDPAARVRYGHGNRE